jgi:hypothetical protein
METELNISVSLAINEQYSTIEYLIINLNCTFDELLSILRRTPRLRHLTCANLLDSDTNVDNKESIILSDLTYLCIDICQVSYEKFEIFVVKICSQLQVLKIKKYRSENSFHVDRWKRIIKWHLPQLQRFDYECSRLFENEDEEDLFFYRNQCICFSILD